VFSELTELQSRCLYFLCQFMDEHDNKAPTRRQLAELMGQKSTHGVNQILDALQRKGYIEITTPRSWRNIRVLRRKPRQLDLGFPMEGKTPA
jgi:SOS-response transcriptional repressor LexA